MKETGHERDYRKAHGGLDVHEDTITVALAEAGQAAKLLCHHGPAAMPKLVELLLQAVKASALRT